jgi:zinc protease
LYPGPRADSRDYHALRIATAILSGQLFSEVRSRQNLTYAVDAPFIERAVSAGGLYVTTVDPERTLEVMRRELLDLQGGTVEPRALERLILQFITQYFLDNESGAQQADFLARAELYYGDFRRADRFVDELRSITPTDIQRAAQRYMRDVRFVYIGDPRKAPVSIMQRF